MLEPMLDQEDMSTLAMTAELPHAARDGGELGRSGAKTLGRERDERESTFVSKQAEGDEPFAFEGLGAGTLDVTGVNAVAHGHAHDEAPRDDDAGEQSDVFVCRRSAPAPDEVDPKAVEAATATVTLFVYGWHQVQPGALSWVFPSLRAALDAVRTMRNAVAWCICSGERWDDIDSARANGAVLIEQLA